MFFITQGHCRYKNTQWMINKNRSIFSFFSNISLAVSHRESERQQDQESWEAASPQPEEIKDRKGRSLKPNRQRAKGGFPRASRIQMAGGSGSRRREDTPGPNTRIRQLSRVHTGWGSGATVRPGAAKPDKLVGKRHTRAWKRAAGGQELTLLQAAVWPGQEPLSAFPWGHRQLLAGR